MFCEDCGYENESRAKYCIGCGKKIETKPPQITIIKREFPFQPKPLLIFIGIALIASLYLLPINQFTYKTGETTMVSTNVAVSTCSQPGWYCSPLISLVFYAFWIIGLGIIIYGIFRQRTTKSPEP